MRITERLKDKLRKAKKDGFERVYCTTNGWWSTTYCNFYMIDWLLSQEIGTSFHHRNSGDNTRHVTPRDIQYTELFKY